MSISYNSLIIPDISRDDNLEGLELTVQPEQEDLLGVGDLGGDLRHPVLHVSAVTPEVFFRKVQCVWKADLEENVQLLPTVLKSHLSKVAKVYLDVDGLSSAGDGGLPSQDSGHRDGLIPPS